MGDLGGVPGEQGWLPAETLGLAMARMAADVLSRNGGPGSADSAEDAVFTAVLNAANECLGRFDSRPAADRWCDALSQVLWLADSEVSS